MNILTQQAQHKLVDSKKGEDGREDTEISLFGIKTTDLFAKKIVSAVNWGSIVSNKSMSSPL